MNGSIDNRPDRPRRWRARYTAPDRKQRSKSFRTKAEAQRWLRTEIAKIDRGSWVDPSGGSQPYVDFSEKWLESKVNIKEKTRHWYGDLLRSRVWPTFGERQLRHIDSPMIRAWILDMATEGLSPARVRHAHQVLRTSLQQAVDDNLIARNPAVGLDLPKEHAREMLFLNPEQLRQLADQAERLRPGDGSLILFLGYTGLRWGEAVALRYRSIDFPNRRVYVTESATEVAGRLVFGTPKSHRRRTVVVPQSVERLLDFRLRLGGPDDLVFTSPMGDPLRSSNYRSKTWLPSVEQLAIDHPYLSGLRVHDLRHTAASLAISCGANIKVVQRMLGHRHASMTLDRYGHLYTEDLEEVADRLNAVFLGVA